VSANAIFIIGRERRSCRTLDANYNLKAGESKIGDVNIRSDFSEHGVPRGRGSLYDSDYSGNGVWQIDL
jgi:hypothetical protein